MAPPGASAMMPESQSQAEISHEPAVSAIARRPSGACVRDAGHRPRR